MVKLVVKGTKNNDEFLYECDCKELVSTVCPIIGNIQNMRHRVKLQLMSVNELQSAAEKTNPTQAAQFKWMYDQTQIMIRDPKLEVKAEQYDDVWKNVREQTKALFPRECQHADGDDAAVDELYKLHDNPDIDEDYRLHVYHCRAIMDPHYRDHEVLKLDNVTMWFCGKLMPNDETIGKYCGNNNKSKITVKLAAGTAQAPSKEPRIGYNDQRELRKVAEERKEAYAKLEESELRDRVVKQSRGQVMMPGGGSGGPGQMDTLSTKGVRHIYPSAQETVVQGE